MKRWISIDDLRGLVPDDLLENASITLSILVRQRFADQLGLLCRHNPIRATGKGYSPGAWICSKEGCGVELDMFSTEKRYDIRAVADV